MRLTRRRVLGAASLAAVGGVAVLGSRRIGEGSRLEFGDGIDDRLEERCRRAKRRTTELVGESLDAPVRVELVDPESVGRRRRYRPGSDRIARASADARHVTDVVPPDDVVQLGGTYDADSRTVSLVDGDPASLRDGLEVLGVETDLASLESHPETLLVHELTHAIQHDRIDSFRPADRTRDGEEALEAIVEGTAEYVSRRYAAACRDGTFDPCVRRGFSIDPDELPLWFLAGGRQAYRNGAAFVHAVVDGEGWEGVWDRHESPPATTAEVTVPERHLEGAVAPAALEPPGPPAEGWLRLGTGRLGIFALYTKLFALDIASPADSDAALDPEVTAATTLEWAYRSSLLEGWRGDRFVAYGHADDRERVGYRWRTEWATETGARELAAAVARGYDDRGTEQDDGWRLEGDVHTIARDGTTVTFGMRPSA